MKPMDSSAREILSKISRKSSWNGLNADQVLIGMLTQPTLFQKVRMIKVSHPLIIEKLGLPKGSRYIAYDDMFSKDGKYILASDAKKASRKAASDRDQYDKELIKVDERVNVEYMVFQGALLRLFPKPKDATHKWYSPIEAVKMFDPKLGEMVRLLVSNYFQNIAEATKSGSWDKADTALDMISKYQNFYGADVILPQSRISAEMWYNKLKIFDKLVLVYLMVGLVVLVLAFTSIIKPTFQPKRIMKILIALLVLTFVAHTFGLGLRWYVAGHAPWSDSYESLIFIAWSIAIAGFYFVKNSPLTFAATSMLAGVLMGIAYISNIDPQITNLVPVLKSFWLTVHVAVITLGDGFLSLGAFLGLIVLLLYIAHGPKSNPNIDRSIKELTYINEISLLIGLGLWTVGTFLGGVWANESWGRYWSWDPKETWSAATVLIYAAVIHMRFVPGLRDMFAFNVAALLSVGSIIMTYFGVNYYLSGLHSYAAGDPVPIPGWVTPVMIVLGIIILWASRYRKYVK
jgi:cytochrome c-type biogenesis protein CcsB